MSQNGHQNDASISIPKPPQKILLKNWAELFWAFWRLLQTNKMSSIPKVECLLIHNLSTVIWPNDEEILVFLSEN